MKKLEYLKGIVIILCFVLFPNIVSGAPSIRITQDAFEDKVGVDETFHITIDATDIAGNIDVAQMPPGVKVVYHTTRQTTKISNVNGKTDQINTTSLILT